MLDMMHSHIGCICLTFPQCAFSNVSSNCFFEKRQSHIDCICLAFLHYAFSNVSSNALPERMQNHTGCTCLALFHDVFSKFDPLLLTDSGKEGEELIFVPLLASGNWLIQIQTELGFWENESKLHLFLATFKLGRKPLLVSFLQHDDDDDDPEDIPTEDLPVIGQSSVGILGVCHHHHHHHLPSQWIGFMLIWRLPLFVYKFVYLFICLFVYLFVCLFVLLKDIARRWVCLFICFFLHLFPCLFEGRCLQVGLFFIICLFGC